MTKETLSLNKTEAVFWNEDYVCNIDMEQDNCQRESAQGRLVGFWFWFCICLCIILFEFVFLSHNGV